MVGGQYFGQDSLISEKPRNATCYAMTNVITAEVTKRDCKVLLIRERQHIDQKISQILMFDLFKDVSR